MMAALTPIPDRMCRFALLYALNQHVFTSVSLVVAVLTEVTRSLIEVLT